LVDWSIGQLGKETQQAAGSEREREGQSAKGKASMNDRRIAGGWR
jgi:hypothetical protein